MGFDESFADLEKAAKELMESLDAKSAYIKQVEKALKELNCSLDFDMLCVQEDCRDIWLSWCKYQKFYRLCGIIETFDNVASETPIKEEIKPLTEWKLDDRLTFLPYLNKFMQQLTVHIKEIREKK